MRLSPLPPSSSVLARFLLPIEPWKVGLGEWELKLLAAPLDG